jgi:hypothetical protein
VTGKHAPCYDPLMAVTRHACLAIAAPGSVEAAVGGVQERIFREHGLASAQALPPLVPLAFLRADFPDPFGPGDEAPVRAFLRGVERLVSAPWRAVTGAPVWREGFLFLSVDFGGAWDQAREAARVDGRIVETGPFPVASGFLLGCSDASPAQREAITADLAPLAFSSASIRLVRITVAGEPYWRDVAWEILVDMPLRGRRQT